MSNTAKILQFSRAEGQEALTVQIRREMYGYEPDWLAEQSGVHKSTIYAIRSGRSKWPRGSSLFPILRAMGYTLVLKKTS